MKLDVQAVVGEIESSILSLLQAEHWCNGFSESLLNFEVPFSEHELNNKKKNMAEKLYDISEKLKEKKEILCNLREYFSRETKKVPFFGDVSNGKSAAINALLGKEVLPSDTGHTTDALVQLSGWDEEYYKVDGCAIQDELSLLEKLEEVTGSGDNRQTGKVPLVEVRLPVTSHGFMSKDTVILDCPGSNNTPVFDGALKEQCQDADVFVMVVDGTRKLMQSEKNFLQKVYQNVATPELFFLVNKWDDVDDDEKDRTREKCVADIEKFMAIEMEYPLEESRIHFVSATVTLEARLKELSNDYSLAFNMFEKELEKVIKLHKEELAKRHLERTVAVVLQLRDFLETVLGAADLYRSLKEKKHRKNKENKFKDDVDAIIKQSSEDFSRSMEGKYLEEMVTVREMLAASMRNSQSPENIAKTLSSYMKKELCEKMIRWTQEHGSKIMNAAKDKTIETLQKDLRDGDKIEFQQEAASIWRELSINLDMEELSGWNGKTIPSWLSPTLQAVKQIVLVAADAVIFSSKFRTAYKVGAAAVKVTTEIAGDAVVSKTERDHRSAVEEMQDALDKQVKESIENEMKTQVKNTTEKLEAELEELHHQLNDKRSVIVYNWMRKEMEGIRQDTQSVKEIQQSVDEVLDNLIILG